MRQAYVELIEKHRQEAEAFPIAYAFSEKQLEEALEKLGVDSVKECVTVFGHGDIVKRGDAKKFIDMLERHSKTVKDALVADKEFAEAAFLYEMDNHEYGINYDGDDDVLGCFGLKYDELVELGLKDAYHQAQKAHYKNMEKWNSLSEEATDEDIVERKIEVYNNKVFGHVVSDHGLVNGKLDYRTLARIVGDMVLNDSIMPYMGWDEWELVNGCEDDEGDDGDYDHIYHHYIITLAGYNFLKEYTDELVYYHEGLSMYIWGVTHYGTSWDYVLTNIKLVNKY